MQNEYKGFPTHQEIENNMHRSFNQLQTGLAIVDMLGEEEAGSYLEQLPKRHKVEVVLMAKYIKEQGRDAVVKKIRELHNIDVES